MGDERVNGGAEFLVVVKNEAGAVVGNRFGTAAGGADDGGGAAGKGFERCEGEDFRGEGGEDEGGGVLVVRDELFVGDGAVEADPGAVAILGAERFEEVAFAGDVECVLRERGEDFEEAGDAFGSGDASGE